MHGKTILVTGGARSGKSSFAEKLALAAGGRPVYCATCHPQDEEMRARVAEHRRRRGGEWLTIEEPLAVPEALSSLPLRSVVVLDCLTFWLTNIVLQDARGLQGIDQQREAAILRRVTELLQAARSRRQLLIIVSNETGSGIVPENTLARSFRDLIGRANQLVAADADAVYFMVAGLAQELKRRAADIRQAISDLGFTQC